MMIATLQYPFSLIDDSLLDAQLLHGCKRGRFAHSLDMAVAFHSESVTEDDEAYHVMIGAPGVRTTDISVMLEGRTLHVKGETKTEHQRAHCNRSLVLPKDAAFNSDEVKVVHRDGVLSVRVPKCKQQQVHLDVRAASHAVQQAGERAAAMGDDPYHINVYIPGVRTADISATLEDRTLRIKGETETARYAARYNRSLVLPTDADANGMELVHEDGVLTASMPKQKAQPRQLVINAAVPTDAHMDAATSSQEDPTA
eukprot:CAMPEP_0183333216 /NCGR_PEP_ID=MMETSP0164_2-20130417/2166_1 /TAXON_ID=221442 /ORGANISM="Coccolithus pelagicus ssp braarudi, Strain PLY182g" /LENGTH=255 /DNA_ID=CAMNT_0025502097 /DNA_START=152 /DNA_END=919 /DNA_ORIENTATION=+